MDIYFITIIAAPSITLIWLAILILKLHLEEGIEKYPSKYILYVRKRYKS